MKLSCSSIAALASAALLSSACDDGTSLRFRLHLDADTCATADPADVAMSCGSAVGVWLRTVDTERLVDSQCVNIGRPRETYALDRLDAAMDDIILTTEPDSRITVEAAVYAPWSAEQGCPTPDEVEQMNGFPDIIMRGSFRVEGNPSSVKGRVDLFVSCVSAQREENRVCHQDCTLLRDDCIGNIPTSLCHNQRADCLDGCADQGDSCAALCEESYGLCLDASVDGRCWAESEACQRGCGDEKCRNLCSANYYGCIQEGCGDLFDGCEEDCPGPGCAAFPGDY
jgi:hypothetical protein